MRAGSRAGRGGSRTRTILGRVAPGDQAVAASRRCRVAERAAVLRGPVTGACTSLRRWCRVDGRAEDQESEDQVSHGGSLLRAKLDQAPGCVQRTKVAGDRALRKQLIE